MAKKKLSIVIVLIGIVILSGCDIDVDSNDTSSSNFSYTELKTGMSKTTVVSLWGSGYQVTSFCIPRSKDLEREDVWEYKKTTLSPAATLYFKSSRLRSMYIH